jgi:hypothetical protein
MLLDELLNFIPSNTEDRVRRARERFNQNIREILRQETGLRLRRSSRDLEEQDPLGNIVKHPVSADQIMVRVELVPGLPQSLRQREIEERHRLAALIAPWRDSLEKLRDSASDVSHLVEMLSADRAGQSLVGDGRREIGPVIDLAERLLQESATFNLAQWILEVDEDVLGAYRYFLADPKRSLQRRRQDSWIELYWAVIGLFARLLVVMVEDLTVVVMAHELAHAYTHLGTDIDGLAWSPEEFSGTEHGLKEGLAQQYAGMVCKRLALAAPQAKDAFDRLLEQQPDAYKTHEPWTKESKPEELRLAMLQVRRGGAGTVQEFNGYRKTARESLRRSGG